MLRVSPWRLLFFLRIRYIVWKTGILFRWRAGEWSREMVKIQSPWKMGRWEELKKRMEKAERTVSSGTDSIWGRLKILGCLNSYKAANDLQNFC